MALAIADSSTRKINPAFHTLVAEVTFSQSDGGLGTEYGKVNVTFRVDQPQEYEDYRNRFSTCDSPLYNLAITAQLDNHEHEDGERYSYAWNIAYHQPYTVDLATAEAMVAFLRKVGAAYKRMIQVEGYPLTFGQCLLRYLRVLGVHQVRVFPSNQTRSNWTTECQTFNQDRLAEACSMIDYQITVKNRDWRTNRWNSERY